MPVIRLTDIYSGQPLLINTDKIFTVEIQDDETVFMLGGNPADERRVEESLEVVEMRWLDAAALIDSISEETNTVRISGFVNTPIGEGDRNVRSKVDQA